MTNRRDFLKKAGKYSAAYGAIGITPSLFYGCSGAAKKEEAAEQQAEEAVVKELFFKISLAQWSLHRALKGGQLDNLDFVAKAKNDFGISAVEYVNQFFGDKAKDEAYLQEMKKRADDHGVSNLLIMIDGEGNLGGTSDKERTQAVENHYKWIEAAKFLGCHSIRVNAAGRGTAEDVKLAAIDGLGKLSEFGAQHEINVIVENHGGYSSDGSWLSDVMKQVNNPRCGTLPDFGNFCVKYGDGGCAEEYDRYKGMEELMPFAKGVSAKSHDFDDAGNEIHSDYSRMLKIVKDAGYRGYIGIEYEGGKIGEEEGIMATKKLLEKVGATLS
ncbi:sugar phosphate isomerase/epimerase family protein [Fulvivirgaceae bacterium BMA10]|uniref:Sugar phosphate isomerase/epimerase family protein n=1 Tax=Splendidivirga corallicola TaxID=3051826 RepID=A0ABT8KX30_9BACT|nr:sugar phosphate isomerase/epimerase family protein [Fulvivirgaceae bacterium BMA10]